jgi:hypothetical protein
MLRRDWRELVGHAVSRGLSVNVGTNGSTVTEQRADDLKRLGVHSVTVSLDSHRPEVHDHFRQFRGLYDRTLTAIRRLVARELRVVVGFTPTPTELAGRTWSGGGCRAARGDCGQPVRVCPGWPWPSISMLADRLGRLGWALPRTASACDALPS